VFCHLEEEILFSAISFPRNESILSTKVGYFGIFAWDQYGGPR
jgi:hypothetical protein